MDVLMDTDLDISDVGTKVKITFKVIRLFGTYPISYIVWEYQDDFAVNEYVAYEKRRQPDTLILYPRRKLIPSSVALKKQEIGIHQTKRGF
jgi:hypothetical protein